MAVPVRSRPVVQNGGLAEWSIASVLKTEDVKASIGSNPIASANAVRCIQLWKKKTHLKRMGLFFMKKSINFKQVQNRSYEKS